jgi:hypothetical protein
MIYSIKKNQFYHVRVIDEHEGKFSIHMIPSAGVGAYIATCDDQDLACKLARHFCELYDIAVEKGYGFEFADSCFIKGDVRIALDLSLTADEFRVILAA